MAVPSIDTDNLIALVGPTSSGKSALAARLAQELPVEVVCMDSMQIYRDLSIGTARPGADEERAVPHHLFGAFSITEPMTSVHYATIAAETIAEIQARGKTPLLVGGTGLYMRALFEGLSPLPPTPPELRERLQKSAARHGNGHIYRMLKRLDPEGAGHLHENDRQRIMRFLEVRLLTGRGMLTVWREQPPGEARAPRTIGLSVPRPLLIERIAETVAAMLARGWVEETQDLLDQGLKSQLLELGPLGYREIIAHLEGALSRKEMQERIVIATRRYAKRQMTWFRKANYIQWFPFEADSGYNATNILMFLNANKERPPHSP